MKAVPQTPQLTLTEVKDGTADFSARYSVNGIQNFAPDIVVAWNDLDNAVKNCGINDEKTVALTFIHRFDGTNWFLTMQCSEMDKNSGGLVKAGNRYDLNNGKLLPSQFQGDMDPVYFANVLFNGQPIDPNTYVHNMTMPWYQEVAEMHCQNSLQANDPNVYLNIASVSFDYTNYPNMSLVPWPHTICLFMSSTSHGPYLDDAAYANMFTCKAADMATVCPPKCNCYDWPNSLPVVTTCMP